MKGIGRLFLAPFRIQVTLVLAVFLGLFLLLLGIGWTHATTYLVLSVLLGLAFVLNVRIGPRARISFYLSSDRADTLQSRRQSRNDIAALAARKKLAGDGEGSEINVVLSLNGLPGTKIT